MKKEMKGKCRQPSKVLQEIRPIRSQERGQLPVHLRSIQKKWKNEEKTISNATLTALLNRAWLGDLEHAWTPGVELLPKKGNDTPSLNASVLYTGKVK